jgi:hypothetical protein
MNFRFCPLRDISHLFTSTEHIHLPALVFFQWLP